MQTAVGQISFTFDSWTSDSGDPYLSVTGHYTSAPPDKPNKWAVRSHQLTFVLLEGRHSGANIGNLLVRVMDRYDIRTKVSDNSGGMPFPCPHVHIAGRLVYRRQCYQQ